MKTAIVGDEWTGINPEGKEYRLNVCKSPTSLQIMAIKKDREREKSERERETGRQTDTERERTTLS